MIATATYRTPTDIDIIDADGVVIDTIDLEQASHTIYADADDAIVIQSHAAWYRTSEWVDGSATVETPRVLDYSETTRTRKKYGKGWIERTTTYGQIAEVHDGRCYYETASGNGFDGAIDGIQASRAAAEDHLRYLAS